MFNFRTLLVRFFCLFLLVSFSNSINAAQSIQAKNVKAFEKINRALQEENYTEGMKLLDELESSEALNNIEKAFIYNFKAKIYFSQDNYQASKIWYEKILSLEEKELPEKFLSQTKKTLKHISVLNQQNEKYNKHKHLLDGLESTKEITDDHYTLALTAYQNSKESVSLSILKRAKSLLANKKALPAKWMFLEAMLADNNSKKIALLKQTIQQHPTEKNRQSFSMLLYNIGTKELDKSNLSESKSILMEAENFHRNDDVLPERWMYFKAKINKDDDDAIELWEQLAKHYPNKNNLALLAGYYFKSGQKQKAYDIDIKLYNEGKLTTENGLKVASHAFSDSGQPLKATLVLAKGLNDKIILNTHKNLHRYKLYFSDAKKDKTITPQVWLDAGDKFVLYGDKDKAKVCFKKAKKDKALRDIAKQRLKELKQS